MQIIIKQDVMIFSGICDIETIIVHNTAKKGSWWEQNYIVGVGGAKAYLALHAYGPDSIWIQDRLRLELL